MSVDVRGGSVGRPTGRYRVPGQVVPIPVVTAAGPFDGAAAPSAPRRGAPVHAQWEELLDRHDVPAPARPMAVEAFRAHHPDARLAFLPVGEPVAAGAVLRVRRRAGLLHVTAAGEPATPAALPADDEASAERFARTVAGWLASRRGGWLLDLGPVPVPLAGPAAHPMVAALCRQLPGVSVRPLPGMPCLDVGPGADPEVRISRNSRAAERRTLNRAARLGLDVVTSWYRSGGDVRDRLPEIVRLHRRRNHQLRGRAGLDDRAAADHFCDVVSRHADAGLAHVLTVDVGDRLGAFAVCLRAAGTSYVYSNLADPDALHLGAGTFANTAVVRYHLDQDWCRILNWGPGVQRYKLSGGAVVVPTVVLEGASGAVARRAGQVGRRLARWRGRCP